MIAGALIYCSLLDSIIVEYIWPCFVKLKLCTLHGPLILIHGNSVTYLRKFSIVLRAHTENNPNVCLVECSIMKMNKSQPETQMKLRKTKEARHM